MNRSIVALIALSPLFACDPREPAKSDGSPGAAAAKDGGALAARSEGPQNAAQPVRFNSLSECLGSCERAEASPTNRETCRLNCEAAYGASRDPAAAVGNDAIGRAATCLGGCYSGTGYAGPGERDTCVSGCKSKAEGAGAPPPAGVLDRLATCVSTCPLDNARPTDRETCELNCAQAARVSATPPPGGDRPGAR